VIYCTIILFGKIKEILTNFYILIELFIYIFKVIGEQTASIIGSTDKEVYIYGDHYSRGGEIIYREFQLNVPALVQKEALDSK